MRALARAAIGIEVRTCVTCYAPQARPASARRGVHAFRVNAPQAVGRLDLSFDAKADLIGKGQLARLRFALVGSAAGVPTIRVEALSFTSAAGKAIAARAPPPVSLNLRR